MSKPLAITGGDCAGIGPEITAKAIAAFPDICFHLYTHRALFERACHAAGVAVPPNIVWKDINLTADVQAVIPGINQAITGEIAYRSVVNAGQDALEGRLRAIVTAPFSKAALHLAGHKNIPGHTELLAHLCGKQEATMAFFSPNLLVSLVTIHCALRDVPGRITPERLLRVLKDTATAVHRLKQRRPRIGVLALNPHAGEDGAFGDEEQKIILPTLKQVQEFADFEGPLVPDTALITRPQQRPYDAFVAMYHDQGLIPFKLTAFTCGVNVTLGLPIIRTSPDHGTAFDLAWKGVASAESMIHAIGCAQELSR
ncbi:MAG: 4-hydroxythreonine-4-phosphate dehydrogenase PdxA [Kiritimatiellae bacterium]|nr:4-hydroxythreonine-4-phosphate dehydrogenase PdxA [Kiritimatiellia bacterium]